METILSDYDAAYIYAWKMGHTHDASDGYARWTEKISRDADRTFHAFTHTPDGGCYVDDVRDGGSLS